MTACRKLLISLFVLSCLGQGASAQNGFPAGPPQAGGGVPWNPGPVAGGPGGDPRAMWSNYGAPPSGPMGGAPTYVDPRVMQAAYAPLPGGPMGGAPMGGPMGGGPMGGAPMGGPMEGGEMQSGPEAGEGNGNGCGEGGDSIWDSGLRNMLFPENEAYPRWYNLNGDFLLLKREKRDHNTVFSKTGINGVNALQTNDLLFHEQPGFRASWQTIVGPGESLELEYFGAIQFDEVAQATSGTNNLYSAFSQFGNNPFGGFSDVDGASLHRITLSSSLNNGELNYRKRFVSPNNRIHNSILFGVRFLRLDESLRFQGQTPSGSFDYLVKTQNNDLGFQTGGDLFVRVLPNVMFGGEMKAGIYGNSALQYTTLASTTTNPTYNESLQHTTVALVGEANLMIIAQINTHWSFKTGYQLLYLDRLALAADNFNAAPVSIPGRVPFINTAGDAFYHGVFAGTEWTW